MLPSPLLVAPRRNPAIAGHHRKRRPTASPQVGSLDLRHRACCTALITGEDRTGAVAGSARRGGPGLPAGLPAPLTAFVGRANELAQIASQVGTHRLVTLVGAG